MKSLRIHAQFRPKNKRSGARDRTPIQIYENIRRDGLEPSISIALAALKVCIGSEHLETGRGIHKGVGHRWSSSVYIANNLIAMYARCGSMADALLVFQSIQQHDLVDLVSWNSMIWGFAENGDFESAVRWFLALKAEGFEADGRTYVATLKACSSIAAKGGKEERKALLEMVQAIHNDVSLRSEDIFVANALIDSYGRCGSLEDAVLVFESMERADLVSWTLIIIQCVENRRSEMGLRFYDRMVDGGFVPDARTLVAALKACESLLGDNGGEETRYQCLERIKGVHSRAVASGHEKDLFVANALVGAYARVGSLDDACKVFDRITHRDTVSWTKMMLGYVEAGKPELSLELYSLMKSETSPSEIAIVAALKACSGLADRKQAKMLDGRLVKVDALEKGMALHSDQLELERNTLVANSLVDMYSRCRDLALARQVFDRMSSPTAVSWNCMIAGYVENNEPELALELYAAMYVDRHELPNTVSVLTALKACSNLAVGEEQGKQLERVVAIHSQAVKSRIEIDNRLASSLVTTYAKCGSLIDARLVFEKTKAPDAVVWNTLILAYVEAGDAELGLKTYLEMKQRGGCTPNRETYLAALKACGSLAALEAGRAIHEELRVAKLHQEARVVNSLVDFYGKCGSLVEAREEFDSFPAASRNLVTWNSMLGAYSRRGDAIRALEVLEAMVQHREVPDAVTFVSLLGACSHAGMVEHGLYYLEAMTSEFGVTPSIEHYSCAVDLLSRANRTEEAGSAV